MCRRSCPASTRLAPVVRTSADRPHLPPSCGGTAVRPPASRGWRSADDAVADPSSMSTPRADRRRVGSDASGRGGGARAGRRGVRFGIARLGSASIPPSRPGLHRCTAGSASASSACYSPGMASKHAFARSHETAVRSPPTTIARLPVWVEFTHPHTQTRPFSGPVWYPPPRVCGSHTTRAARSNAMAQSPLTL